MVDQKQRTAESTPSSRKKNPAEGHLFILSAPSGAGKTTLRRAALERFPDLQYSVSYTTRKPRQGEQEGVDYYFIDQKMFEEKLSRHLWAEWARVHGHYYGTSAAFLENTLSSGSDILLDIDVQGTLQILDQYPDSITIFILPPSMETLRQRLKSRGTDSARQIEQRLVNAEKEMAFKDRYRHVIINDELRQAVKDLIAVIESYRPNTH
jgi:guanylate kinase